VPAGRVGCRQHERNESVTSGRAGPFHAYCRPGPAPCFRRLVNYSSDVFPFSSPQCGATAAIFALLTAPPERLS